MFVHPHILEWFMDLQALGCWKASIKASQRLQSLAMLVTSISIIVSSLILTCFILIEAKQHHSFIFRK